MPSAGPLVSVLIPCFNAGRWIGETIESIYRQSWENVEIVIVNDGSTDNSLAEINRQKSDRLKVLDQTNHGQHVAYNRALEASSGAFIQYLDADDALERDKIRNQMRRLESRPGCVASCTWRVIGSSEPVPFVDPAPNKVGPSGERTPVDWLVEDWREGGGMMYPALWLVPRDVLRRAGPWRDDVTLVNDMEFFSRVVTAAEAVLLCPDALSYYRKGHPSLSGVKTPKAWRSYFLVMELCTERLLSLEASDRTRRVASFLWQRFAIGCYPYNSRLAMEGQRRAELLHGDRLWLPAGPVYNITAALLGWKFARRLQVLSGRHS